LLGLPVLAANQGFGVDPLRIHEIAAELARELVLARARRPAERAQAARIADQGRDFHGPEPLGVHFHADGEAGETASRAWAHQCNTPAAVMGAAHERRYERGALGHDPRLERPGQLHDLEQLVAQRAEDRQSPCALERGVVSGEIAVDPVKILAECLPVLVLELAGLNLSTRLIEQGANLRGARRWRCRRTKGGRRCKSRWPA